MNAGLICNREVYLAEPDELLVAAAKRMEEANVGTLLVLDQDRRPRGILTDRDIALRAVAKGLHPDTVRVDQVMTREPECIDEGTPLEGIIATMRRHDIRRLPVVGPEEQLIGIVSLDDVLLFTARQLDEVSDLLEHSMPRRNVST